MLLERIMVATINGTVHKTDTHTGQIVQVIGSTFDAEFEEGHLPEIYNAIKIDDDLQGRQHPSRPAKCSSTSAAIGSAASPSARPTA